MQVLVQYEGPRRDGCALQCEAALLWTSLQAVLGAKLLSGALCLWLLCTWTSHVLKKSKGRAIGNKDIYVCPNELRYLTHLSAQHLNSTL